jgi:hypothetical protein
MRVVMWDTIMPQAAPFQFAKGTNIARVKTPVEILKLIKKRQ